MLERLSVQIFVHPLTDAERQTLASVRGERAPRIAAQLGCDDQTMPGAPHAFNATGLSCPQKGSSRLKSMRVVFDSERAERMRSRLRRSPRDFGKPTSVWTLELASDVRVADGLILLCE